MIEHLWEEQMPIETKRSRAISTALILWVSWRHLNKKGGLSLKVMTVRRVESQWAELPLFLSFTIEAKQKNDINSFHLNHDKMNIKNHFFDYFLVIFSKCLISVVLDCFRIENISRSGLEEPPFWNR